MLLFIVGFFTLCFICFDIDENETVANEQLKDDSLVNCRSKHKLIDEEKKVKEPKEGMLFGSIEKLLEYYRNYAKQEGFGVVQKKKKKYVLEFIFNKSEKNFSFVFSLIPMF
jgi:hypothetical protein